MSHKGKGSIDSSMRMPSVPGLKGAPGSYNKHPDFGPAGVDGGFPLKFTDDSIPKGETAKVSTDMVIEPRRRSK